MNVLITGAAGFIGLNVVRALLDEQHEVHAYVRPSTNSRFLAAFDVKIHHGELQESDRLNATMRGIDAVIHCAGKTSCYRKDYSELFATNVLGTRNVVEAAIANRVKRLVFTSTTSTSGAKNDPQQSWDESTELTGFRKRSPYSTTKCRAEQIVLNARERGLETVILNPAEVIGPFDHNLQWGRMVLAVHAGQLPFIPPGSASFCSAQEVGNAHVSALRHGKPFSRYILAGVNASFREFVDTACAVIGKRVRVPKTPYSLVRYHALMQLITSRFTKRMPLVDPYRMKVFGGHYLFRSDRAAQDLNYRSSTLSEMIESCYAWYRQNKFT